MKSTAVRKKKKKIIKLIFLKGERSTTIYRRRCKRRYDFTLNIFRDDDGQIAIHAIFTRLINLYRSALLTL